MCYKALLALTARVAAAISTRRPGVDDVADEGDLFRRGHVISSDVSDVAEHEPLLVDAFRFCVSYGTLLR